MTLSMMTLRIRALSIMTLSIIDFIAKLSIMTIRNGLHCNTQLKTLRIMKFSIMHLFAIVSIMTLSKETLSIMALIATLSIAKIWHNL
jgi:hypothetical protein